MPSYCVIKVALSNGDHELRDVTSNKWCLPAPGSWLDLG